MKRSIAALVFIASAAQAQTPPHSAALSAHIAAAEARHSGCMNNPKILKAWPRARADMITVCMYRPEKFP